jgi:CheY-like chemotaxis protein
LSAKRKPVLLVDDDASIRETVAILLGEDEYDLVQAASGEEALVRLRDGFRGLVLLDVMMPGLDGWEVVHAMESEGLLERNVLCMLTAVQDPGPALDRLKDRVQDYVRKPFTAESLLDAVEANLSWLGEADAA